MTRSAARDLVDVIPLEERLAVLSREHELFSDVLLAPLLGDPRLELERERVLGEEAECLFESERDLGLAPIVAAGSEAVIDGIERRGRDRRRRAGAIADEVDGLLPALGAWQMRKTDAYPPSVITRARPKT
ncbi:MAG: hypothetical protein HYV07_14685 [Deltaproteobacteria bacterium]|nr:hypothetical protein [Deltaproteobacteria bacterium]